jgi:hypothetical protein
LWGDFLDSIKCTNVINELIDIDDSELNTDSDESDESDINVSQ